MIRRTFGLAVVALLALPAAAAAQQYPPATGTATVSDSSVAPGEAFTISGSGCAPTTGVGLEFDSQPQSTTTSDGSGAFSGQITVPQDAAPGQHTASARCDDPQGQPLVLNATITVEGAAAPTAGTGALPATGSDSSIPLTKVAVMLVLVGGAFVVGARRRAAQPVAARIDA